MFFVSNFASILSALLIFLSSLLGVGAPPEQKAVDIDSTSEIMLLEDGQKIVITHAPNTSPTVEERAIESSELVTICAGDGSWSISGRFTGFAGAAGGRILLYTATNLGEAVEAYDYSGNKVFSRIGVSKINPFHSGNAVVNEFDLETLVGKSYYVNQLGEKISDDFSVCSDFNECGYAVVYLFDGSCGVISENGDFALSPEYDYVTLDGNVATAQIGDESIQIPLN